MLDCMRVLLFLLAILRSVFVCAPTTQGRIVGLFLHNALKKKKLQAVPSHAAFIDPAAV